jgi:hypothetical protein
VLAAALTGCSSSGHDVCCGPLPVTHVELAAEAGPDGQIEPTKSAQTVTLQGASSYLRVDLDIFPGVDWNQAGHGGSAVLQDDGPMDRSSPEPCATTSAACQSVWSEQYQAKTSGTTTLTWMLVASGATPSASPTVPAPACPTGATAPQLQEDEGCDVGQVTITVIVKP